MLSILASLAAESEHHVELPLPAAAYGLIALLAFALMLGALFAFRQAATKVAMADNTVAHDDHGHHAAEDHR